MANKKSKAGVTGGQIMGFISLLLVVVLVIGWAIGSNGFKENNPAKWDWWQSEGKDNGADKEPAGSNGAFITDGEAHGIKLMSAEIPQSAYEAYGISTAVENAFTLTAKIEPLGATDYLEWTVSNNDDEAISIEVAEDNGSAVVTCNKAFSVQKTITVTSTANSDITASCTVDYYKRLLSVSFEMPKIKLNTTSTEYSIAPIATYGIGTVEEITVSVTGGTITLNQNLQALSYTNFGHTWKFNEKETFTGDKFSLIMSPNSLPSFCDKANAGSMSVVYSNMFKAFVSELSNPNSTTNRLAKGQHYSIEVNWTATRRGNQIDSGTVTVNGEFDVSALTVPATNVTFPDTNYVF